MSEYQFVDHFSGRKYRAGDPWVRHVRSHLASLLEEALRRCADVREMADAAAEFWTRHYHRLVFPLHFGFRWGKGGEIEEVFLFDEQPEVDLDELSGSPLRSAGLDRDSLPPLWPGEDNTLVPEQVAIQGMLLNLLLRKRRVDDQTLHQARLGCYLHPLHAELSHLLEKLPQPVRQVAAWFARTTEALPNGLPREPLLLARELKRDFPEPVALGAVAVQRIKKYVFESNGLPEIRGASTLLDECTDRARQELSEKLGPEVILRAAGSAVVFLGTDVAEAENLCTGLRRIYLETTGVAMVSTAALEISVADLLGNFNRAMSRLFADLESRRSWLPQPGWETLPFEARCRICALRPAEGWIVSPEGEPLPCCGPCARKRREGRAERERKARRVLEELGLEEPSQIGVASQNFVASTLGTDSEGEDGFIPEDSRYKLLATVYGDGNNFGAVNQSLTSVELALQWTHRVERTTWAATAIALAKATKGASAILARRFRKLPFQILELGGDDFCLFAWSPVALRFAATFLRLTDREFGAADGGGRATPPSFSIGMVVTDHRASVRRTVEIAEQDVLRWAKQACKADVRRSAKGGKVAYVLAVSQDQLPQSMEEYLGTGNFLDASDGVQRDGYFVRQDGLIRLCLTLRPYSAEELSFLLDLATRLKQAAGPLQRLVSPFVRAAPMAAFLHYAYQKERLVRRGTGEWMVQLAMRGWPGTGGDGEFPFLPVRALGDRLFLGLRRPEQDRINWFTVLWDLLEFTKMLE